MTVSTLSVLSLLAILSVFVWGIVTVSNRVAHETEQHFAGEVVDRHHDEVTLTTGIRHDYSLTVRTDTGQMITWPVKGSVYESFAVGDRIVKHAGQRWPTKG